ncbi:MAG: S8 family serine peptidase, partial [Akkermansiaceae bacterium]|nr:S8 family serine peptidase [Akkermansiaceae bacterium]
MIQRVVLAIGFAIVVGPLAGGLLAAAASATADAVTEPAITFETTAGGEIQTLVVALDEALTRDADGGEALVRLNPPATPATLAARLAALPAPGGTRPVAYPSGAGRSPETRRILTPEICLKAPAATAAAMAARHGLAVKEHLVHAPDWVILRAADPLAAVDALRHLRATAHAELLVARLRFKRAMPNDPLVPQQWHLNNANPTRTHMNLEGAWNFGSSGGARGAGIRIGITDDGLQTGHPDLSPNTDTTNDKDWNGGDSDPNPGTGDDHGTACAGNAAARGNNNLGVSGSAPEATLVGLRLIAASVTDAQEAEAMAWRNDIIEIKSNSWGPSDTGTLVEAPGPLTRAALEQATATGRGGKGTIILWAGGNGGDVGDNSNYDGYANSIHTMAVGASDSAGNRAYYSEPGANLVVCAPSSGATGITTTDRTGFAGYASGDYTDDFGGTSSATPSAAGVVALMLGENPNLGWRDVQEILMRSAYRIKPGDSGWSTNSGGLAFHHDFGAGLIDAGAAVSLAAGWTNLAPRISSVSTQAGLSVAIPDSNATGITREFDFSATNLRVEHAAVRLTINHTARGNLEITLTSPSGMVSRLTDIHSDSNNNYADWTFTSVRHWGESASGTWRLKIADRSTSGNSTGGTLVAAELTLHGTPAAPVNPAPLVRITAPENGAVFSPGATVQVAVEASDLTSGGSPGAVGQVELFGNGVRIGVDATAPYAFAIQPATGTHSLEARATDSEGATGVSATVLITVANQTPLITAASLTTGDQAYTDETVAVA